MIEPAEALEYLKEHKGLAWGIPGVILVILGLIAGLGTMTQKVLFLLSTPLLTTSAYVANQRMLFLLQLIVTENAILAFMDLTLQTRAVLLVIPAVAVAGYLIYVDEFEDDRYWPIGWLGLLLLAAGFSTAGVLPFYANLALLTGPALIALYSLLGYLATSASVLLIWVILNIALAIPPAISLIQRFLG